MISVDVGITMLERPRSSNAHCFHTGLPNPASTDPQETLQNVRRGFPILSNIDPARLSFQVRLHENSDQGEWVTMLDESWKSLIDRDGLRVRVVVEDTAEERTLRESVLMRLATVRD